MARVLIYSSAKRLLAAGRTGFGTVARSRKISTLAVGAIERLSQFDSKRGVDRSRVIMAHRRINVGNTAFHLLSSIRDAGADYTGRTNHLAHHLLVDANEARQLAGRGITPADILQNYEWLKSWDVAPRYFEDSEDVDLLALGQQRKAGTRENWTRLTGNGIQARLIASKKAPKSALLVLPDREAPLPLMAEAFDELDAHSWGTTFTTALESSDSVSDFAWVVTTASAFPDVQERCLSRAVMRADQPEQLAVPEERPVAQPASTAGKVPPPPSGIRNRAEAASGEIQNTAQLPPSQQTPQQTRQPAGKRPKSDRPASPIKRVPLLAIIGASAALLMAMVIFILVVLNKDDSGNANASGTGNLSDVQDEQPNQLSDTQKGLLTDLESMNVPDSEMIAKSVNDIDCGKWKKYFEELNRVSQSDTPWIVLSDCESLRENKQVPTGAPKWLDTLVTSNAKDNVISRLALLAYNTSGNHLNVKDWKDFNDVVAAWKYGEVEPFSSLGNPFPKMASELLRSNLRENFNNEDFKKILELGIWTNTKYKEIPGTAYLQVTKNAKTLEVWEKMMSGYEGVGTQVKGDKMSDYFELFKDFKTADKEKVSSMLVKLKTEHQSKPDCLLRYFNRQNRGELKTSIANNETHNNGETNKRSIERYYHDQYTSNEEIQTSLIEKLINEHRKYEGDVDINNGFKSGWKMSIDDKDAIFQDQGLRKISEGSTVKALVINPSMPRLLFKDKKVVYQHLELIYQSEKEFIFFNQSEVESKGSEPVWGEHSFKLQENGDDLELKGELRARLNEIVDPSNKISFNGNIIFVKSGKSWKCKDFFKWQPPKTNKKGLKFDSVVPSESYKKKYTKHSTDPRVELIRLYKACEKICTEGDADKEMDIVKDLHYHIDHALKPDALEEEFIKCKNSQKWVGSKNDKFSQLKEVSKYKKLVGFAKFLEERSKEKGDNKNAQKKRNAAKKAEAKKLTSIKVYAGGSKKRLLFKGKDGKFIPQNKSK
jgi:hypothetical protein